MDAFLMSINVWEGIVVGVAVGLTILFVQLLKEKVTEYRHKNRIYDWLYQKTKQHKGLTVGDLSYPRWISTIEIAAYTNLTPDRVRYICSIDERIRLKMKKDLRQPGRGRETLEEKWGIREFID